MVPSLAAISAIGDSDSGAQWRWRQYDLLRANGGIAIGANGGCVIGTNGDSANSTIGDSAICETWAIGADGDSAKGTNNAIGSNFANGTIANGVIGAIANGTIGANGDSANGDSANSDSANGDSANGDCAIGGQQILLAPMSLCATVTIANGTIWMAPLAVVGANDGATGDHWRQWAPLAPMKSCPLVPLAPIILQTCSIVLPNIVLIPSSHFKIIHWYV